ncbi:MAG: enolase C-terminal domain-like protein [Alphaproteobacteria bacterium]
MKISSSAVHIIPVNHRGNWVLIELNTEDGLKGWGEGSNSKDEEPCVAEMMRLGRSLEGNEIDPAATGIRLMEGLSNKRLPRTPPSAVAQALFDLECRASGISAAEKLACKDNSSAKVDQSIAFYSNINRRCEDRKPETIAAAGRLVVAAGCTRIKIAPFDEVSPNGLRTEGEKLVEPGIERLAALRKTIGPDIDLMIDNHWRFTSETAALLASICKEFAISWIEDPLEKWIKKDCDILREVSGGRVVGGEDIYTYGELEDLAKSGCIDLMIADIKFVGGTAELDRICKMAATHGIGFAPHNPDGPISTASSAHVVAANSNAEVLEYSFGEVEWRHSFAKGEHPLGNRMSVSGPGYGVDIVFENQGKPVPVIG